MAYSQSKIPIPRLHARSESLSDHTPTQRRRASRACQSCRARKAKCDEGWPVCSHCKDLRVECYYTGGKREERNRRFELLSKKEAEYEAVLSEISLTSTDPLSRVAAQSVLEKFSSGKRILDPSAVPPDMSAASTRVPDSSWMPDDNAAQPLTQSNLMANMNRPAEDLFLGCYIDNPILSSYSQVNGGPHGPMTDLGLGVNANTIGTEPSHRVASTASMIYPDLNVPLSNNQNAAHFLS